eukprot:tig00000157_g9698.t1
MLGPASDRIRSRASGRCGAGRDGGRGGGGRGLRPHTPLAAPPSYPLPCPVPLFARYPSHHFPFPCAPAENPKPRLSAGPTAAGFGAAGRGEHFPPPAP